MSTYTQILYQIVFSTKNREKTLITNHQEKLFKYIWGIIKNNKSVLYQINGMEDHVHIVTHLHPTVSLSSFVKDIKMSSSVWIKKQDIFPDFTTWQEGYGGFTYSIYEKNKLINYVKDQKDHHKTKTFMEEYIELLNEHNIKFDKSYLL